APPQRQDAKSQRRDNKTWVPQDVLHCSFGILRSPERCQSLSSLCLSRLCGGSVFPFGCGSAPPRLCGDPAISRDSPGSTCRSIVPCPSSQNFEFLEQLLFGFG